MINNLVNLTPLISSKANTATMKYKKMQNEYMAYYYATYPQPSFAALTFKS